MESKLVDENKGHDVEEKSAPNERRLYSRDSSLSSSVRSSEFEEPLHGDNFQSTGIISTKKGTLDQTTHEQQQQQSDGESTSQSPPVETVEQTPDSRSGYRIPLYAFSRNKSGNPMNWSNNSSDSLFSIQMGTTSFTHDQFNSLMYTAELEGEEGYNMHLDSRDQPSTPHDLGGLISSVEPMASPSEAPYYTVTSTDVSTPGITSTSTEPVADDGYRKGDSQINTDHRNSPNTRSSPIEDQHHHSARCSDASVQSFAFPVLLGDLDRGNSTRSGHAPPEKSQEQTPPQQPHKPSSSNTHEGQAEVAHSSWYSCCFSCCSRRS